MPPTNKKYFFAIFLGIFFAVYILLSVFSLPIVFLTHGKDLPSTRQKTLVKWCFSVWLVAEWVLPCVAHGKTFVSALWTLPCARGHTVNFWNPIVYQTQMQGLAAHHVVLMKLRAHLQFSRYSRVLFNFYFYLCFSFIHAYNSVLLIFFLPVVTFFSR